MTAANKGGGFGSERHDFEERRANLRNPAWNTRDENLVGTQARRQVANDFHPARIGHIEDVDDHILFGAEIPKKRARADAAAPNDFVDGDFAEAALEKQRQSGESQLFAHRTLGMSANSGGRVGSGDGEVGRAMRGPPPSRRGEQCRDRITAPGGCLCRRRELLSHFDGRPPKPEYAQKLSTVAECFCGHLSPKEREILSLVGAGMSNREVAEHIGVTEGTVKWYLQRVYDKVGTRRRQQAVQRARQFGLIAS
jgi:RNA polymerase sigma factor (sigma-70 family)